MTVPYSLDLRQKILQAVDRRVGSQREIAELFGVSLSFVELRGAKARNTEALDEAVTAAIDTITPDDAQGWFEHCGYPLH